jgi:hypothetical protein
MQRRISIDFSNLFKLSSAAAIRYFSTVFLANFLSLSLQCDDSDVIKKAHLQLDVYRKLLRVKFAHDEIPSDVMSVYTCMEGRSRNKDNGKVRNITMKKTNVRMEKRDA